MLARQIGQGLLTSEDGRTGGLATRKVAQVAPSRLTWFRADKAQTGVLGQVEPIVADQHSCLVDYLAGPCPLARTSLS